MTAEKPPTSMDMDMTMEGDMVIINNQLADIKTKDKVGDEKTYPVFEKPQNAHTEITLIANMSQYGPAKGQLSKKYNKLVTSKKLRLPYFNSILASHVRPVCSFGSHLRGFQPCF